MKKNTLAVALMGITLLAACKKKDDNNKMSYSINNISDVVVTQFSDTTIQFAPELKFASGEQESITILLTGLPDGVTTKNISATGYPSFGALMPLDCYMKTEGSYPVTLTAKGLKSGTKTLTFNLIVKANKCQEDAGLVGVYSSNLCGEPNGSTYVYKSTSGKVRISGNYDDIIITPDCFNTTHSIEKITGVLPGGDEATVSGNLTHTDKKIIINWNIDYTDPTIADEVCTEILTKFP